MTKKAAAKARWFADTERLILGQRPDISGRIVWSELEYLQLILKTPLDAAAVYLARHDELVKPYAGAAA